MRNRFLLIVSLTVGVQSAVYAKCLSRADLYPQCRYPAGDSWCVAHSRDKPYAYTDRCLRKAPVSRCETLPDLSGLKALRQGMRYSKARKIILDAGWQALYNRWQDIPESGRVHDLYSDNGWLEIVDCAGTGLGECLFKFMDMFGNTLEVVTIGECIDPIDEGDNGSNKKCDLRVGYWSVQINKR